MTTVVYTDQPEPFGVHLSPRRMIGGLWAHRGLIVQFARREVASRYRGHTLGPLWTVLQPLALLGIFTFLFAVVFRSRWRTDGSIGEVALQIFAGLIVFGLFREMAARAPGLVVGHANYVKRVVFPLQTLPLIDLLVALFTFAVSLGVWLVGWVLIERAAPHPTILLVPLLMVPVCLSALAVSWTLAALGVFVRDIANITDLALTVLFFLTPVFYSADRVPPPYDVLVTINPIAHAIGAARWAMLGGPPPDWAWWAGYTVVSALLAVGGYAVFMKSRRAFADVL
ncbi:MAG: ABC transporter permease [Phycisphaerales bacterium]